MRTEPREISKDQFLMSPDLPLFEFEPDPDGYGKASKNFLKGI